MKKLNHTTYFLLLIALAAGCVERSQQTTFDTEKVKSEVEHVFQAYVDHVNTAGLASVDTFFLDDERFFWVEDGLIQYPSKAALAQGLEEFLPQVKSIEMKILNTKTHVLSENHASFFVRFNENFTLNSGYNFTLDGAITILFEKKNDTWKFLNGHSSIKKPRGN